MLVYSPSRYFYMAENEDVLCICTFGVAKRTLIPAVTEIWIGAISGSTFKITKLYFQASILHSIKNCELTKRPILIEWCMPLLVCR